jgi:hypothetical protein
VSSGTPSEQAISGWDDSDPDNAGFFFTSRSDDPDAVELEAQRTARLRAMLGDEDYERLERSRALSRHPRPLTPEESSVLRAAVAPLLRDMEATGRALPDIREEAHEERGEDAVCAWIQESGGIYGQGISVLRNSAPADRLFFLAEQLQSWAGDVQVDPGRRPWPDCPDHTGSHTLAPDTRDEVAVWYCPETGHVIARMGMLA